MIDDLHDDASAATPEAGAVFDARELAMLRQRSIDLAAVPHAREESDLTRVLVFRLGPERYGLPLAATREIGNLSRHAIVPGTGPGILGVVNWRGDFVVVLDLAAILGASNDGDAKPRIIVLDRDKPPMAIKVDAVEDIVRVDLGRLQNARDMRLANAALTLGVTSDAVVVLSESALAAELETQIAAA